MTDTNSIQKRIIYARNLGIAWGDNSDYWSWLPLQEETLSSETELVEVAKLKAVCWLDVNGKLETSELTPNTNYEVVYVVKLEDPAYGWETPVTLKLTLPNNSTQERSVNLEEYVGEGWVDIPAGEFETEPENAGEISFSLFETHTGFWKKGLFVNRVEIRPTN